MTKFQDGETVLRVDGVEGTVLSSVQNYKTKAMKYLVQFPDFRRWMKDVELEVADPYDEGYRCRSCDAVLGSHPTPCPMCDGLPGYGNDQYHAECEEDLRLHEETWVRTHPLG